MPQDSTELALIASHSPSPRPCRGGHARVEGPGWFDSSWDLRRGLDVRETWSDDDRGRGGIGDFLLAQRAVGRTASPSASTAIA